MKLTITSLQLIPYFLSNYNQNTFLNEESKKKNKYIKIIELLFNDILQANKYLKNLKNQNKKIQMEVFDISIKKIMNIYQIPKPTNFPFHSFPSSIQQHINEKSLTEICFTFSLFEREIKLYFIIEDSFSNVKITHYQKKVDVIILWLFILNKYASKKCSKFFTVFFYFTSLTKNIPFSNSESLKEEHVNTAFTSSCPLRSEIIIYRKEEWLKVFIHETFHNFALDFSDINSSFANKLILDIFPVNSKVNLYEAYTEFWAELLNSCLGSYYLMNEKEREKENFPLFLNNFHYFIELEKKFSCFQMVKILNFMGLSYSKLFSKDYENHLLRTKNYREKTNVLSYYVLKTILLFNYTYFLQWCFQNNTSLLQFNKTKSNLINLCNFIFQYHQNKWLLKQVKEMENYFYFLKKENTLKIGKREEKGKKFLLENLRMSICELG